MNRLFTKRFSMAEIIGLLVVAVLSVTVIGYAATTKVPNIFTAGTTVKAGEVNTNFSVLTTLADDHDSRIAAIEATVATLQSALTAANSTISTLQSTANSQQATINAIESDLAVANTTIAAQRVDLDAVRANSVLDLDTYLTLEMVNGHPAARFSGVNVQVVSGAGTTDAAVNGTGNLIVGYDDVRTGGPSVCSIGSYTDQPSCQNNGGTWAISHKTGSHNLVVGKYHNYSQYAGVVFGYQNTSSAPNAGVSGGTNNTASGVYASVTGGSFNTASGGQASINGGSYNTASGGLASVSAGFRNTASGGHASVTGGSLNTASGVYASVSGGIYNTASGNTASVSGGGNGSPAGGNMAATTYSSILGGVTQTTTTPSQTIPALP